MDVKLKLIVTKIERSKLSVPEKNLLYQQFVRGIQLIVWPILVRYMSRNRLNDLMDNPDRLTVDSYCQLISGSLSDGRAFNDIARNLDLFMVRTNSILAKYAIT